MAILIAVVAASLFIALVPFDSMLEFFGVDFFVFIFIFNTVFDCVINLHFNLDISFVVYRTFDSA